MFARGFIVVVGLLLAGWGHLLVHDLLGAGEAWVRVDSRFPPMWRSEPAAAGGLLLCVGALCALVPLFG